MVERRSASATAAADKLAGWLGWAGLVSSSSKVSPSSGDGVNVV
jgi:hypothetical protein